MDGNSKVSIYVCIRMGHYSFVIVTQLECLGIEEITPHQSCYLVSCPDSLSRFFLKGGLGLKTTVLHTRKNFMEKF